MGLMIYWYYKHPEYNYQKDSSIFMVAAKLFFCKILKFLNWEIIPAHINNRTSTQVYLALSKNDDKRKYSLTWALAIQ